MIKLCNKCFNNLTCPICNNSHELTFVQDFVPNAEQLYYEQELKDEIEKKNKLKQNVNVTHKIEVGEIYIDSEGKKYEIIAIARDSHQADVFHVIYQALYNDIDFGNGCVWSMKLTDFSKIIQVTNESYIQNVLSKI
jgi:hypothetical protein